jgi:hypothetical protein
VIRRAARVCFALAILTFGVSTQMYAALHSEAPTVILALATMGWVALSVWIIYPQEGSDRVRR